MILIALPGSSEEKLLMSRVKPTSKPKTPETRAVVWFMVRSNVRTQTRRARHGERGNPGMRSNDGASPEVPG